jgi:hypothetical protein
MRRINRPVTNLWKMSLKTSILILLALLLIPAALFGAGEIATLQDEEVTVLFEEPLRNAAEEVIEAYPIVKSELERTFHWEAGFRAVIRLTGDSTAFKRTVGNDITVAFAVPDRYFIVIDNSKVHSRPFTLKTALKHELCHLLLHHHIAALPRWLDEGVCQWVSGGITELIMSSQEPDLTRASLSGNLLSIGEMARFPDDEGSLRLAYAESRSIVEYITGEFGREGLLEMLDNLRQGLPLEEAMQRSLHVSVHELEGKWHEHLEKRLTWFTYISDNLYFILLAFAALITVYGFIRFLIRKRAYRDEEDGLY